MPLPCWQVTSSSVVSTIQAIAISRVSLSDNKGLECSTKPLSLSMRSLSILSLSRRKKSCYRVGLLPFAIRYYEATGIGRAVSLVPFHRYCTSLYGWRVITPPADSAGTNSIPPAPDVREKGVGAPALSIRNRPPRRKAPQEQLLEVEHEEFLARLGIYAAYLVGITVTSASRLDRCVAVHPMV